MSDNLIGIIVTALIATGGGIVAYFKWIDSKQTDHQEHENNKHFKLSESQQKARDTVWEQMQDLAEVQSKKIAQLISRNNELIEITRRIQRLEDEIAECRRDRRIVIEQLAKLSAAAEGDEENGTIT